MRALTASLSCRPFLSIPKIQNTVPSQYHEKHTPLISLVCVIFVDDEGLEKRGSLLEQHDETRASSSIGGCATRPISPISRLTRAIALVPGNVPILRARIPVPRTHFVTLAAAQVLHRHVSAAEGVQFETVQRAKSMIANDIVR